MGEKPAAPAAADPAQTGTPPQTQDGSQPPADGGQQQPQGQQPAAADGQATQAGQSPASAAPAAPDGTRDPYQLLGDLLSTPEGTGVFNSAMQMLREDGQQPSASGPGQSPPSTSPPPSDTAALQQRAEAGDAEAKAELYDRQTAARSRQVIVDEGKATGRTEALKDFFAAPDIQALGQAERMRIADTYMKEGAHAALNQAVGMLRETPAAGAPAAPGEDAQAQAASNAQAAAQQKGGAPVMPGAVAEEGPTPQPGQTGVEALENALAWTDEQKS